MQIVSIEAVEQEREDSFRYCRILLDDLICILSENGSCSEELETLLNHCKYTVARSKVLDDLYLKIKYSR